jgi:hypothetical protein
VVEGEGGIPIVIMGLGHIGQAVARAALEKPELRLVAAVDPAFVGHRLEEVLRSPAPQLTVSGDAEQAFALAKGGVVLHATGSSFERVLPQIEQAVKAGLAVVSTCEELAYPWLRHEELAARFDQLCEKRGVAVVGVGVNPGFALDRLPALLSQVTGPVRHVHGTRVQDVSRRRAALQRKVGVGLDEASFHRALDAGEIGHVGLAESAMLAAEGCGFELDEVEEEFAPVIAEEDHAGPVSVASGRVAGIQQIARGFVDGVERVRLELTLAVGEDDPRDVVELDARPPVRFTVRGGIPGDEATAWAVVHAAPAITELRGLVTVLHLPSGR